MSQPPRDPESLPATSGLIWAALLLVAFLAGGIAGAGVYGTLMTKPTMAPQVTITPTIPEKPTMYQTHAGSTLTPPNTREAQPGAVTPQHPDTLDPQTREWYANMAKHGYVPMTIMVPKGTR